MMGKAENNHLRGHYLRPALPLGSIQVPPLVLSEALAGLDSRLKSAWRHICLRTVMSFSRHAHPMT